MGQGYAIFRNTVMETVRQPVYGLVIALSCSMIAFAPAFASQIFTFQAGSGMERGPQRMIADLGLANILFSGLVLAIFCSANVISREIENRTAITVLSKQVNRTIYVFGKYAGVACAITMACVTEAIVVLLTVRMGAPISVSDVLDWWVIGGMIGAALAAVLYATLRNYFRGRAWIGSFSLSFFGLMVLLFVTFFFLDNQYNVVPSLAGNYDNEVLKGAVLGVFSILILTSVAVAASTRLSIAGNFTVTLVFFLGGLTSSFFRGQISAANPAYNIVGAAWQRVLPNLEIFWMSDALTRERDIPAEYLFSSALYTGSYILAVLFFAAYLFEKREVT